MVCTQGGSSRRSHGSAQSESLWRIDSKILDTVSPHAGDTGSGELSMTMNDPGIMPIQQLQGVMPVSLGVNSTVCKPRCNMILMLYCGTMMPLLHSFNSLPSITHFTGTPLRKVNWWGEKPLPSTSMAMVCTGPKLCADTSSGER